MSDVLGEIVASKKGSAAEALTEGLCDIAPKPSLDPGHPAWVLAKQAQAQALPTYLTVKEASALLRVSGRTIYRLIEGGQLAAERIGKQWRILARELPGSTAPRAK